MKLKQIILNMTSILFCLLLLLMFFGFSAFAQEQPRPVTQDDVDEVASRMYCPVCENEPLDACYNPTCIQWKDEIARQLSIGRRPDEIINYFVDTYGQHVVGVPQDGFLRTLSFAAPIIGTIFAVIAAVFVLRRWQAAPSAKAKIDSELRDKLDDNYRSQIERDVS